MEHKKVVSALIGLAGAVNNNGKTPDTDGVVKKALQNPDDESLIDLIHREKFHISPGCEFCADACGNTSDYDISKFELLSPEVDELMNEVFASLQKRLEMRNPGELSDTFYKAIYFLGQDLEANAYRLLLKEIEEA